MSASEITGFAPILPHKPRALILGSMPGVASLDKRQYYGHPANLFWPIVARVIGFSPKLPYHGRIERLRDADIALWDVLRACERKGSADAAIVADTEQANNIHELIEAHATLRFVLLNGGKAHAAFQKHIIPQIPDRKQARLRIIRLPSTSPANASIARQEKFSRWTNALHLALDDETDE